MPRLWGANSTEIVQVPPFGASVPQVFAVTLNGGVAAGAVVNVIGDGLGLLSVMLKGELTLPVDTFPKASVFGLAFIVGAIPLPLRTTICLPDSALLFTCNVPLRSPVAVGTNPT